MNEYLFTSESVSEGHPDKVADQISDAVLDAILDQDPKARVAAETLAATNLVVLAGEITTSAKVDYENIARTVLKDIGYDDPAKGIDYNNCKVNVVYGQQSPDIAQGVDQAHDDPLSQGAGDQGLMFGYACQETPTLMPMPIWLSHKIVKRQATLRKNNTISWLRPDAKSQVTLKYEDNQPKAIDTIVVSTQHDPDISLKNIRESVVEEIIKPEIPAEFKKDNIKFLVNPTGNFVIGGPEGDCGLTGRKIIVDTYGGAAPHGGGAFSGKDPSKVDRSAAYAARYVAKNIVASKLANRCLVQLSYAIGVAEPTSIMIDTFGTSKLNAYELEALVRENFDLRPRGIVDMLDLLRPIYRQTAAYGHFGREDIELPWEKTDQILK